MLLLIHSPHPGAACYNTRWSPALQDSVVMVRDLFRQEGLTEFVIATIPTVLGINESARLLKALRKERIPCTRIVVNQVKSLGWTLSLACTCDGAAQCTCVPLQLGAPREGCMLVS